MMKLQASYIWASALILFLSLNGFTPASEESPWLTDFEKAKSQASEQNKVILMSFTGSDWCGNCMRLEQLLFHSEAFNTLATDKLVLLQLDFPAKRKNQLPADQKEHNEKLAQQYNKAGAFPTMLVLDSKGNLLGKVAHPFNSAEEYIKSIQSLIP